MTCKIGGRPQIRSQRKRQNCWQWVLAHVLANDIQDQFWQEKRFLLLLKIGFVTLDPPRDSGKLCILLQGFVWETYVSYMKIVHKIRSERF